MIPYLRPYRRAMFLGLGAMLLATGFSRLIPWILKIAVDGLTANVPLGRIVILGLAMIAAAGVSALFLYLQRWQLIGTSRRVEYDLRRDLFHHVQRLDLATLSGRRTGDVMAHFTNDLAALRDVAGPGIMYAATMSATLVLSIALMVALDPWLTLISFAPYPFITLAAFFFGRSIYPRSLRVQDLFGAISSRVQEDLAGTRVVRAYGQEEGQARRFDELNQDYLEANLHVARLRGFFLAATTTLAGCGLVIALLVGGRMVIAGKLSLGALVALSAYLAELTWPVMAIGWVIAMVQRGASAAARLSDLRQTVPHIVSGPLAELPAPHLRFENVTFRYPGASTDALRQVSFELRPGNTLGIVGRVGSGKSTILKLILRFYDPSSGRILLDGADLRARDLAAVRRIIGYAPQDAFLFSRSIAGNVTYGRPEAGPERIQPVVERAGLTDEIAAFPDGLRTRVGERGITLSGGQRQRVSLARALLPDPAILLLDDTLSSVDAETGARVLEGLRATLSDRTAVIISHRISAVRRADWILALDDGRIVEEGTHAMLLAKGGMYARMHQHQQLAAEIEEVE
ncbi:MAG: ABC transporter ATP-binding protein [Candidatus Eisenbacteria bacterium]